MTKDDTTPLVTLTDIPAALGLLSRLPVPVDFEAATARGPRSAWAYPVAGLVLALIAALCAHIALSLGLPAPAAAGLALATLVMTTGAMHEDGLADSADGLWGGWTSERRLDIMKDSHTGAYGVIALILGLGLRWVALTAVIDAGALWAGLIATAMLSRAAMVPLMARLPHARSTGLSHSVGQPSITTARLAEALGVAACVILFGWWGLALVAVALVTATACAWIANAKIAGQTGDILGATQQMTEIMLLLAMATLTSQ
ncbi:adenosylcobinamide-GDP ribazoletransferase [Pseudooctadecabacter jejudonensis]|uniref:Adenosylcobinamide-GDP ribazoletransferase n=1 Tax=Pseudooctadecabacter jejudonensis TaxID=1391910 RepID=A0A1Y5RRE1_9RHOB|nr:adenosylcobinamide-GDP ribazoletransferase [Pseudooctadecabacter jejudonensis]SLN20722.1 Cobalamin synthase [Pseudooctadecabacter jejudonensis]